MTFPLALPFPVPGPRYRLRAVVVHLGDAGVGHYVAFVRCHDEEWYYCDDFRPPEAVSVDRVLSSEAYLLFYEG